MTVHHNCTDGRSHDYGLYVYGSSSSTIQLVSPLSKEQVSTNNGGGGNWGASVGDADINQIKTVGVPPSSGETKTTEQGVVRVPDDCNTLEEAVKKVHEEGCFTTIVVGKGKKHQIDGKYLEIFSAMNIVGDSGVPKEKIVIIGGVYFKRGVQGNCHLQHVALRQAEGSEVLGHSSFSMTDVFVEQCDWFGVLAADGLDIIGRCTNVKVRQCEWSGVVASYGASITLIGAKTTVHHNCTKGKSGCPLPPFNCSPP